MNFMPNFDILLKTLILLFICFDVENLFESKVEKLNWFILAQDPTQVKGKVTFFYGGSSKEFKATN